MNNNVWNVKEAGPQKIEAWSPHRWRVTANHSRTDVRLGSIKSYACTQKDFTNRSIESFSEVKASWSMTCPPDGEWNGTFDIWPGKWGALAGEIMVWTHHRYNGPLPPRNATESTTVSIDGQTYIAWRRPLNPGDSRWYIALAMITPHPEGSIDLRSVFGWLVHMGWMKDTDLIAAIEYGIEIANTVDGERVFDLNDYQLEYK